MLEVTVTTEQLRYKIPGGIATYIRGLQRGFADIDDVNIDWYSGKLPLPMLTRAWGHGWGRVENGDILHSTSLRIPPSSRPLIATVHDVLWRQFPETFLRRGVKWHEKQLQSVLKQAHYIVTFSDETKQALLDLSADPDTVKVIAEGCDHLAEPDEAATDLLLQKHGVRSDFLLSVGTIEPRKNLPKLIEAFNQANESASSPMTLVVVGPQGWLENIPNSQFVKFVGAVSPAVLSALYKRAKLFLYVPLAEGFGLPPLEAMSQSTAVITSNVPSVTAGAQIVDENSVDDMAKAIFNLNTDDAARDELAKQGNEYSQSFRWKNTAQAHLKLWTEVAGG